MVSVFEIQMRGLFLMGHITIQGMLLLLNALLSGGKKCKVLTVDHQSVPCLENRVQNGHLSQHGVASIAAYPESKSFCDVIFIDWLALLNYFHLVSYLLSR